MLLQVRQPDQQQREPHRTAPQRHRRGRGASGQGSQSQHTRGEGKDSPGPPPSPLQGPWSREGEVPGRKAKTRKSGSRGPGAQAWAPSRRLPVVRGRGGASLSDRVGGSHLCPTSLSLTQLLGNNTYEKNRVSANPQWNYTALSQRDVPLRHTPWVPLWKHRPPSAPPDPCT